jgi:hypothetical protein
MIIGVKRSNLTTINVLTPVPTTPMERLGRTSKDNTIDKIIRLALCM